MGTFNMKKILLIDSDERSRFQNRMILQANGYEIETAENGKKSIKKAALNPDMILIDIFLSDVDGYEVIKFIREQGFKGLVIVCSLEADITEILDAGGDYFIKAPFTLDHFLRTVNYFSELQEVTERMEERLELSKIY